MPGGVSFANDVRRVLHRHHSEESPAFLQAVQELGRTRQVVTSQPIFNAQGAELLGGATVDQGLYERLVSHRLSRPLDECVEAEPSTDARCARSRARGDRALAFFARVAPPGRTREIVLGSLAAVPLPKPPPCISCRRATPDRRSSPTAS